MSQQRLLRIHAYALASTMIDVGPMQTWWPIEGDIEEKAPEPQPEAIIELSPSEFMSVWRLSFRG